MYSATSCIFPCLAAVAQQRICMLQYSISRYFPQHFIFKLSWDSSTGIVPTLFQGMACHVLAFSYRQMPVKSLLHSVQTGSRATVPPPQWYGKYFPSGKRSGSKSNQSLPSSAKVMNAWIYISTSPYVFMRWCLINNRDNFIFIDGFGNLRNAY